MIYAKISTLITAVVAIGSTEAQDLRTLSLISNWSLRSFNQSPQRKESAGLVHSGVEVVSKDASKKALRLGGNRKARQIGIGISSGGPKVDLLDPANGDVVKASNHAFKFRVTESQGMSKTMGTKFSVTLPEGHPYTNFTDIFPGKAYLCDQSDPYGVWTICRDAPNLVAGEWTWQIEAEDENGKTGKSEVASFTVDLIDPRKTCKDPCFDYEGHCICIEATSATKCSMTVDDEPCSCCEHNGEELTGLDCPVFGKSGQCAAPVNVCESPCFEHEGHCLCAQATSDTKCSMTVDGQPCSCCKHDGESITAFDCPIIGKVGQCGGFPFPF